MALSVIALILSTGAVCGLTSTQSHDFHYIYGCYESDDVRVDIVIDDDVVAYADFNKKEVVWAIPHLPQPVKDIQKRAYEIAKASTAHCHSVLGKAKKADPGAPPRQGAPDIYFYTRYEAEVSVVNTLFCVANHFYPPTVNFTWTKNGVEVTEGISNLRYRHNRDGTFHRISTLIFSPQPGDYYSCKVEHQAAQVPVSKSWELKVKERSGVSPAAVFFGVSMVLCLMGFGTGVFFFTKQSN
ncbi:H-2 class II histocompatibility antigen, A-Q alpha chain-like [Archocentrus centrarchus]|uniref:H-2 class II histocompatibility antigen, A-Q alpha chain-like n=1 Tax=Archocentrus centrarchus TaxID=63155 RepID=UPI0011EA3793|nr:H-2 class II histocompatibility antigen, A-Q alpha chain-like [Archocentrus centrarchus]